MFKKCKRAVVNTDDSYGDILYDSLNIEKSRIGIVYPADAKAVEIKNKSFEGIEYFYKEKDLIFKLRLKLAGLYNVYNSLLAIKCTTMLGIKPNVAKSALNNLKQIEGRLTKVSDNPCVVIDYAHTPFAMKNALKSLYTAKTSGQKLIIVFGCGGDRDKYKRSKMGKLAIEYADVVYITEDNSRSESFEKILSDILSDIKASEKIRVIKDRETAILTAIKNADQKDIVALIGKGHERYIVKDGASLPFSEKQIVEKALQERKNKYENKTCTAGKIK